MARVVGAIERAPDTNGSGSWPRGPEVAAVIAFWLVYGARGVMNGLFPPGGLGPPVNSRWVVGWGLESLLWML
ncbi:MAG: hypothetical protein ACREPM_11450, partial [Gemmatimonadaceae bacterium]